MNIYYGWMNESADGYVARIMHASSTPLIAIDLEDGDGL
jgi:hypothetical protein